MEEFDNGNNFRESMTTLITNSNGETYMNPRYLSTKKIREAYSIIFALHFLRKVYFVD